MGAITASPPDVLLVSQLTSLRLAVDHCERYDRCVFRSNCHTLHGTTPAQVKLLSDEERVVLPAYSTLRKFFLGFIKSGTDCF